MLGTNILKRLTRSIDGMSLALFRICFGLVMLWELFYFIRIDFVKVFLINPQVQLSYAYTSFIKPLPEPLLDLLIIFLMISCMFIVLGVHFKKAMIFFCVGFTYLFLLDKAYYNNHLYMICLLSFLLIFVPADNVLSFKKRKVPNKIEPQYWHLLILRLQIAIVYFFGGIAKLNYDWLISQQPVRIILLNKAGKSQLAEFFNGEAGIYFFTYGGLLFDLLIPFLLFIPKTRLIAIIAALLFNILNAWLFDDINIFPYFMMAALVLFLDSEKLGRYIRRKDLRIRTNVSEATPKQTLKRPIFAFLILYFIVQLIMPFRHFLYQGNVEWTGAGQRFSWRMKIQHRSIKNLEFRVFDMQNKIIYPVDMRGYGLNNDQINTIAYDPSAVLQFANFLEEYCKVYKGMDHVEVKSNVFVTFNGRSPQHVFDPEVNLLTLDDNPFKIHNNIRKLQDN
ncbi:HTTM domain-containing protein [Altibacter lentus]|uniref:HTTM domain-containing protein n=1 Tax=Altibacter lentus TaxID=1223410 RepID=UPI000A025305|nr:HTTM domain-containing protein [Altibacter lentus]